jgi:hypothetical protein
MQKTICRRSGYGRIVNLCSNNIRPQHKHQQHTDFTHNFCKVARQVVPESKGKFEFNIPARTSLFWVITRLVVENTTSRRVITQNNEVLSYLAADARNSSVLDHHTAQSSRWLTKFHRNPQPPFSGTNILTQKITKHSPPLKASNLTFTHYESCKLGNLY